MNKKTTYKTEKVFFKQKQQLVAAWESPSNIALIKYWGKKPVQLPQNASLSFGLSKSVSKTSVKVNLEMQKKMVVDFTFEGKRNPVFAQRIEKYLQGLQIHLPYLKHAHLIINSKNTFPHSSGIASSASAMSALALCLLDIEYQLSEKAIDPEFYQRASFLARLGSGSAARSVYPGFVVWGKSDDVKNSSDEHAVQLENEIHPSFQKLNDAILITSSGKKTVSSSAGHQLMEGHPYAEARYIQAGKNMHELIKALKTGDEDSFIKVVENEALSLHALMMSSANGFSLLNKNTWAIIEQIHQFRSSTGIFVAFTLDAGPNVHLVYKAEDKNQLVKWIEQKLLVFCETKNWIDDIMGSGPKKNDWNEA